MVENTPSETKNEALELPKLSRRLLAICETAGKAWTIADIGTDHGLLPIYMLLTGQADRAVATDLREGPLSRARANAAKWAVSDRVRFARAYGLDALAPGEADSVTICGMGGMLIADILEKALGDGLIGEGTRFVLAPNSQEPALRRFLAANGFDILSESAVRDGREVYLIIYSVYTGAPYALTDEECYTGRCGGLGAAYYRKLVRKVERRLAGLRAAVNTTDADRDELLLLERVREAARQYIDG